MEQMVDGGDLVAGQDNEIWMTLRKELGMTKEQELGVLSQNVWIHLKWFGQRF
jgi:hypothetical protein